MGRHCVMMLLESVGRRFDTEDIEKENCRYLSHLYAVTIMLWGSTLLIGANMTDLGFVLSLSGCICSASLGFILPALVIIKTNGLWANWRAHICSWQFMMAFLTLFLGVCTLFIGTFSTIYRQIYDP